MSSLSGTRTTLRQSMTAKGQRHVGPTNGLVFALLGLAAFLRFFRLDGQSLWYDEGVSAGMLQRDLPAIIRAAAGDIHPPLYYIVLHLWGQVFGSSEVALRSLSAVAGTATVGVTYLLACHLFGRRPATLAALMLAVSPLAIHYSQEARMYMLVALFGTTTAYFYARLTGLGPTEPKASIGPWDQGRRLWLASILPVALSTAATLYTQYFGALVLAALNVHFLLNLKNLRAVAPAWLAAQAMAALLYLPWLPVLYEQARVWPAMGTSLPADRLLSDALTVLAVGLPSRSDLLSAAPMLGLAALGALPWRRPMAVASLPSLLFAVPMAVLLGLATQRPMYEAKFLMVALPPFCTLAGRAVDALSASPAPARRSLLAVLLLLAALQPIPGSLIRYYFDPAQARDDYRGIVQRIAAAGRPDDGIILNAPGQQEIFGYYFRGPQAVYPLPRSRPPDPVETRQELERISSAHPRLWMVLWASRQADPTGQIEDWLNRNAYLASDSWYGNVRLLLYATSRSPSTPDHRLDMAMENGVQLLGYSLHQRTVTAGDIVQLTLFWRASGPINERYKVFTHLLDRHDNIFGQRDSEPVGGRRPTTTWHVDETVVDLYGIPVLPGTPPGPYMVEFGMYRPEDGARPQVFDRSGRPIGNNVRIGPVQVERPLRPPPTEAVEVSQPMAVTFQGGPRLLGFDLHPLGRDVRHTIFRQGETILLTLYWEAPATPLPDYLVRVTLVAPDGSPALVHESRPAHDEYPTSDWTAGELVRDPHRLPLPKELLSASYQVRLSLVAAAEGQTAAPADVLLTTMTVR